MPLPVKGTYLVTTGAAPSVFRDLHVHSTNTLLETEVTWITLDSCTGHSHQSAREACEGRV